MPRRRIWAVPAAALALAACAGGGLDRPSTEACDAVSAWMDAGSPADRRAEVTERVGDLLGRSDSTPLTDPYVRFRDTREEDLDYAAVVEAGANFLRACGDHGWERPGG
ncbi:hypothetical protein SAMN05660642_03624 [Geodermatophilus siccatus]|uniref:Lipoprotein n=1 Tax=Geodermatophilus siccatus TaxID=1137991 RepID=A0A1G9XAV5_9ACTN|nr:hypothetical protein [Geodermatophilus siccatus]SDM93566.1 hypothetical protein SAMN05660642_03624 [Geodermatophilus siccatus]